MCYASPRNPCIIELDLYGSKTNTPKQNYILHLTAKLPAALIAGGFCLYDREVG
jgi:hypothetical protein